MRREELDAEEETLRTFDAKTSAEGSATGIELKLQGLSPHRRALSTLSIDSSATTTKQPSQVDHSRWCARQVFMPLISLDPS